MVSQQHKFPSIQVVVKFFNCKNQSQHLFINLGILFLCIRQGAGGICNRPLGTITVSMGNYSSYPIG